MKKLLYLAAVLLACAPPMVAGDLVSDPKTRLIVIDVNGKDKVVLAASSIVSIAKHRFLLNGSLPVDEVTIDTVGNSTLRFYCVENNGDSPTAPPSSPGAGAQQVGRKISSSLNKKITDGQEALPSIQFPNGVYAHTIEYQVSSPGALDKLFAGALAVWEASAERITNVNLTK